MQLNEKGYYFTLLMYGLFSAVSVQKSVRDRLDGIPCDKYLLRAGVGLGDALPAVDGGWIVACDADSFGEGTSTRWRIC